MFCAQCGTRLNPEARFCSACGAPVAAMWAVPAQASGVYGRLERPRASRMIAGVCAGLAQHYRWDLTWVRVFTVLIAIFSSGAGLIAYFVFWIVMPEQPLMLPSPMAPPPPLP